MTSLALNSQATPQQLTARLQQELAHELHEAERVCDALVEQMLLLQQPAQDHEQLIARFKQARVKVRQLQLRQDKLVKVQLII